MNPAMLGSFIPLLSPAMLSWHPRLSPGWMGLVIVGVGLFAAFLYRRMRTRMSTRRATVLMTPKCLALLLLLIALLDPTWTTTRRVSLDTGVLVLLDTSSSMDVKDDTRLSRADVARQALDKLRRQLPTATDLKVLEFNEELSDPDAEEAAPTDPAGTERATDIGGALLTLADGDLLSSYSAVVLVTDGGDEPVDTARLPAIPLNVVGVGLDPSVWDDIAIAELQVPPSVEKETQFEIVADIVARTGYSRDFTRGLDSVAVALEKELNGEWQKQAEKVVNLSNKRVRVRFQESESEPGPQAYRLSVAGAPAEMSLLNNRRIFTVEVRRKALHLLYFTRELGTGFKMLRSELAADPGITFTALFRTIGQRYTVQGERLPGDELLEAGFPDKVEILRLFDCLVIGSFPRDTWTDEQLAALVAYVEGGGSAIFLGGEQSFGEGGYSDSPLEALFPWRIPSGQTQMRQGNFPVTVPATAVDHPVMAGIDALLAASEQPLIESLNDIGAAKPGAIVLMQASLGDRTAPLAASQRFGRGRTMAIGSNTFWKWAKQRGPLKDAYGLFWRQAVRALAETGEGERFLSILWNKSSYRPGERAVAEVRLAGEEKDNVRMAATLAVGDVSESVPVEPLQGQSGIYLVKLGLGRRGTYRFALNAYHGDKVLESYERVLEVGPMLNEGANLELDGRFLTALAAGGGGLYVRAHELERLVDHLKTRNLQKVQISDVSFVHGTPYYMAIFLIILMAEWVVRRRMNLF